MSFINTIAPNEAQDEVLDMYLRQQSGFGFLPNYSRVFCYRPHVMTAWANLQYNIRSTIDKRRYELVTLIAAMAMGSTGCSLAHAKIMREEFFTTDELMAIAQDEGRGVLSAKEQLIVRFTKKVVLDPVGISNQDVQLLKQEGCTDEEIFDVVAVASARCFFARIPEALGVEPDAPLGEIESQLRETLTVGREVSTKATYCIE